MPELTPETTPMYGYVYRIPFIAVQTGAWASYFGSSPRRLEEELRDLVKNYRSFL